MKTHFALIISAAIASLALSAPMTSSAFAQGDFKVPTHGWHRHRVAWDWKVPGHRHHGVIPASYYGLQHRDYGYGLPHSDYGRPSYPQEPTLGDPRGHRHTDPSKCTGLLCD